MCEYGNDQGLRKVSFDKSRLNQVTGYKIANNKGDIENDPCRQSQQTDRYIRRAKQSNIFRNLLLFVSNANNH